MKRFMSLLEKIKIVLQVLVSLLIVFGTPQCALCQTSGELSHQERFAPAAKAMEKAEGELSAKLTADPKDASLLSSRGLLRLQLNRVRDALADLHAAAEAAPSNAQFHINLAYGLLLNQKPVESIAETRKALALEDKNYAAHGLLGRALLASGGDSKEAIEHLQRSLELYPSQTDLCSRPILDIRKQRRPVSDVLCKSIQIR
jgi:tetratricopeptide (TPR) repeat protein